VVTLTATAPAADGWLTGYPSDEPLPTTSSLTFSADATVANLAELAVGADGNLKITNTQTNPPVTGGGTVHIVVDLVGYFS
jgi:hypothetical protein